jgi:DNA repair protein RecN (Recombination protein N)
VVALDTGPDPGGLDVGGQRLAFDSGGVDRVRFDVATNPGEPPRPLAKVASGGETARIMLALRTVLGGADGVPTLIFDEIDAGIGGRLGAVVGRKLWAVAATHQVLCVTHLPQVAAYADAHYHVSKAVSGGRTITAVERLEGEARPAELGAMLGSGSPVGLASALELLDGAESWKQSASVP